jgi:hypothetical protein
VFVNTENDVKNMISSLKAVSELQNPAVKDRLVGFFLESDLSPRRLLTRKLKCFSDADIGLL